MILKIFKVNLESQEWMSLAKHWT